jgi:hypothetical protein
MRNKVFKAAVLRSLDQPERTTCLAAKIARYDLYYYLWGHTKNLVYEMKSQMIAELTG